MALTMLFRSKIYIDSLLGKNNNIKAIKPEPKNPQFWNAILITVSTCTGRIGFAKNLKGEWFKSIIKTFHVPLHLFEKK